MIILLPGEEVSEQAIQTLTGNEEPSFVAIYPAIDLKECMDKEITFLDLKADGSFQALVDPEAFAGLLVLSGLSKNIETINLLVSDIYLKKSMFTFAQELCNALAIRGFSLTVRVVADLNYITFINPPSTEDKNWQIYGISVADYVTHFGVKEFDLKLSEKGDNLSTSPFNLKSFIEYNPKQLLWEGEDILAWLAQDKERKIIPRKAQDYSFPV